MTEERGDRNQDIARITVVIPRVINREDNEMLTKPVSMREVCNICIRIFSIITPLNNQPMENNSILKI